MEAAAVKFILLSVFLAHSAVVYTVCNPVAGGFNQPRNQDSGCAFVILDRGVKGASDRGPISFVKVQKKTVLNKKNNSKQGQLYGSSIRAAFGGSGKDERFSAGKTKNGWRMSSDLDVKAPRDTTIQFTINAQGKIETVTVVPFSKTLYQTVCNQLNHISFTWHGDSTAPICSRFEKKICVRY
jgi:hypothetical protein